MGQLDREDQSVFKQGFLRKTADARIKAGYTQEAIATLLNVPQDKYKHYEKRSLLPHHLIAAFCIATRTDPAWLFGLPSKRPTSALAPKQQERLAARQTR